MTSEINTLLVGLAVEIFAGVAAFHMAKRKGRSPIGWAVSAFLLPVLLLVLLCLRAKREAAAGPAVLACSACGRAVSVQAMSCPHCGQPQRQIAVRPWYAIPVEVAGTAVTFGAVVLGIWWVSQTGTLTGRLPRCNSDLAKIEVNRALANAPLAKIINTSVKSFDVIRSDYTDDKVVRCSADVTLNNATQHRIAFSFTARDDGNYWVEARILER